MGIFKQSIIYAIVLLLCSGGMLCGDVRRGENEGYYAFEKAPSRFMRPPQVRKPPYMMSTVPCQMRESKRPKYTLCGDLNKGFIPLNPMGQEFHGHPYPFELIKNKTLIFLSKTLPYLKEDPKIPKVTKFQTKKHPQRHRRSMEIMKNTTENETSGRQNCESGGILCSLSSLISNNKVPLALVSALTQSFASSLNNDAQQQPVAVEPSTAARPSLNAESVDSNGGGGMNMADAVMGLLSTLSNMGLIGNGLGSVKDSTPTEEEPSTLAHVLSVLTGASPGSSSALSLVLKLMASDASPLRGLGKRKPVAADLETAETRRPSDDLPPTPCPSSEEYVTPTFARNYQGVWKYVVQIPQEGYFTQTVQQTKCMNSRCDFMDGVCHESPRWVSLLVAEIYYPDSFSPTTAMPPVEDFYNFQQYLKRRVGEDDIDQRAAAAAQKHKHCDGFDAIGCYVVRLYYDWFLVNGSCKCWKPSPKRTLMG